MSISKINTRGFNMRDEQFQYYLAMLRAMIIDPENPSGYAIKIVDAGHEEKYETIEIKTTSISTTAKKIETLSDLNSFIIYHKTQDAVVYIGDSNVEASSDYIELERFDQLKFKEMQKDNNNEIYGITASGTVTIYCIGVI